MCDSRDKDIPLMKPIYFSREDAANPKKVPIKESKESQRRWLLQVQIYLEIYLWTYLISYQVIKILMFFRCIKNTFDCVLGDRWFITVLFFIKITTG